MSILYEQSKDFLDYLEGWTKVLPSLSLKAVTTDPAKVAVISVDVINGFCTIGPLASPRVAAIVDPIVKLFKGVWTRGVRDIILTQDTHEPDAVEFGSFPPHCVRGTVEAETVDAFKVLPFFDQITVIPKNSIASGLNTGLVEWLAVHSHVDTFIVVGDCTDLCTYQLAMHLRLDANARQLQRRVIVPADCVDTYDTPLAVAKEIGAMPHPGNLLHAVFLYHLALNGVEVVKTLVS
ncbi:MAG TPA: isochorismatase family cysteine hydrolase [Longilinea sp.]|nr:isochorismatase family cysteine hydrolase [Longilinea sp.]